MVKVSGKAWSSWSKDSSNLLSNGQALADRQGRTRKGCWQPASLKKNANDVEKRNIHTFLCGIINWDNLYGEFMGSKLYTKVQKLTVLA